MKKREDICVHYVHYGAKKFIKLFLTSITHQIQNQFDRISLRNSLISNSLCAHAKHVSLKLQNGCAQILNSAGVYRQIQGMTLFYLICTNCTVEIILYLYICLQTCIYVYHTPFPPNRFTHFVNFYNANRIVLHMQGLHYSLGTLHEHFVGKF